MGLLTPFIKALKGDNRTETLQKRDYGAIFQRPETASGVHQCQYKSVMGQEQKDIWLGWGRTTAVPVNEVTLLWHCGHNFQLTYLHILALQSLFGSTYIFIPH